MLRNGVLAAPGVNMTPIKVLSWMLRCNVRRKRCEGVGAITARKSSSRNDKSGFKPIAGIITSTPSLVPSSSSTELPSESRRKPTIIQCSTAVALGSLGSAIRISGIWS